MKVIEIVNRRKDKFKVILDDDFECDSKIYIHGNYAATYKDGKRILLHRLIMGNPVGYEIDHINRNKLDNRKENLRVCTKSENMHNRGFKGITFNKACNQYVARITVNGIRVYLGKFDTELEAMNVYKEAKLLHHGIEL
ncbi:hypothetical protein BC7_00041 [Bacillus phage BC-7]|nr:hypothetical protein BC7_00041 [Bacillus phage BC-7]